MNEPSVLDPRIVKIVVCPSLSQRTSITYHLGCSDNDEISFRIWDTSGKGVFSKEWVSASDIQKVLDQHQLLNATTLLPLFKVGRSVNTAGFLLAVLKHEQLVAHDPDEAHKYVPVQPEKFVAAMATLIKSGASLDPVENGPATEKGEKGEKGGKKVRRKPSTSAGDTTAQPGGDTTSE